MIHEIFRVRFTICFSLKDWLSLTKIHENSRKFTQIHEDLKFPRNHEKIRRFPKLPTFPKVFHIPILKIRYTHALGPANSLRITFHYDCLFIFNKKIIFITTGLLILEQVELPFRKTFFFLLLLSHFIIIFFYFQSLNDNKNT